MAKKTSEETKSDKKPGEYRVLARKYRPQNFSQLKGQDALVRTLTNAIESGRIAHAFMLTGVRGVGKTTTARIIARALNCEKGPTVTPCGVCEQCKAIAEDRHVDVLELDAASRNKVEDIRSLVDTVHYAPASARYKVFILDEVHMLSTAAFNALLKTLEEPPEHVKFIFATTEIRKVPVTILTRCQRFDLRRIDADILEKYFGEILEQEKVKSEGAAVSLIARAADGSARDGLSLLDQAISRQPDQITEEQVRAMLGLVDRSVTLDLFEALVKGDSVRTMTILDDLYKGGAAALMVLQDLLDLTHYLTKIKVSPDVARDQTLPEAERVRGAALAKTLGMPVLARAWQMLLKGISEVQYAPNPQSALEMVLIRLLFTSDQPSPSDVLKQLKDGSVVSAGGGAVSSGGAPRGATIMRNVSSVQAIPAMPESAIVANVNTFEDVVELFGQRKEMLIRASLMKDVHLVKFQQGHIELRVLDTAPRNLTGQVAAKLSQWTGRPWVISLSRAEGKPTLASLAKQAADADMNDILQSPVVAEVMRVFPGAKIADIKKDEE